MTTTRRVRSGKIRVVIVDDSEICRSVLQETLQADGDIEVVGEASDGHDALGAIGRLRPDLVTLDVEMPKMDGLSAVEQIMAACPVPILIVTGRPTEMRVSTHFEAVRRGALDVATKPALGQADATAALREHVRQLSRVPVMRHLAGRRPKNTPPAAFEARIEPVRQAGERVVAIAASAGGPAAVAAVLAKLPRDFPAAIGLVQHLLPDFAQSYVRFLRGETALSVELVDRPMAIRPGTVFVAPDGRHLVASGEGTFAPNDSPPTNGYRPSADMLFRSLARTFGATSVGVVLSGIGDDGAAGLLEIRQAGGLTIAQDEPSSVVYGMPRAAFENGAASRVLSPDGIAAELMRATASRSSWVSRSER